ncbi:hypothetical protein NPIL_677051 [Nephila pilipes]|uniref:Uncharacterized protein n=1 Tax=Nephila pilipes TaxID=299642 RepID=A0A8X6MA11_NEPPI|nr:hypothetical protein NPIL_677051 [Nephila pilipes]
MMVLRLRRPAKCRHPTRNLYSSEDENRRGVEPAPIPSPKRALRYQNPSVLDSLLHKRQLTCFLNRIFLNGPVPLVDCHIHLGPVNLAGIYIQTPS